MRKSLLAVVWVIAMLVSQLAGPAWSGDKEVSKVALGAYGAGLGAAVDRSPALVAGTLTPNQRPMSQAAPAFCGQCTQDDDCGTGHKCCGPSNCRQCFQVVTCP